MYINPVNRVVGFTTYVEKLCDSGRLENSLFNRFINSINRAHPRPPSSATIIRKASNCLSSINDRVDSFATKAVLAKKLKASLEKYAPYVSSDEKARLEKLIKTVAQLCTAYTNNARMESFITTAIPKYVEQTVLNNRSAKDDLHYFYARLFGSMHIDGDLVHQGTYGLHITMLMLEQAVREGVPFLTEEGKRNLQSALTQLQFAVKNHFITEIEQRIIFNTPLISTVKQFIGNQPIAKLYNSIGRSIASNIAKEIREGKEPMIIEGGCAGISSEDRGHVILYNLYLKDGKWVFNIINTGPGAELQSSDGRYFHNFVSRRRNFRDPPEIISEALYTNLEPADLNEDFFKKLIEYKCGIEDSNTQTVKQKIASLYQYIDKQLNKGDNRSHGREYQGQVEGICTSKTLFVWLHGLLGDRDYQAFQIWLTQQEISTFEKLAQTSEAVELFKKSFVVCPTTGTIYRGDKLKEYTEQKSEEKLAYRQNKLIRLIQQDKR